MSTTTKLFFVYSLYFVIALGAYVFFYMYITQKSEVAAETSAEAGLISKGNEQFKNLNNAAMKIEADSAELTNFFVDSEKIVELLEAIEGMGETAHVNVEVKSIQKSDTESAHVEELVISVDFDGSWTQVHHFLVLFENLPIKMTLDNLRLRELHKTVVTSADDVKTVLQWDGSVTMRALQRTQ